jgi:hypothetical protein
MRWTRFVCAGALTTALLSWPMVAAAQRETETVNRTVPFPDKGVLKLHNFSGSVKITATNGREVVIKAVRRAERDRLDQIKLEITTSGSTVSIEANRRDTANRRDRDEDNVVETEFEIQVPAAAELDVNVFKSDLTIAGVTGPQSLETFSGNVVVTGGKGAIDAKTFSGRVEIDLVAAGTVPDLSAETFSGEIRTRLADGAKGTVRFTTFSGRFDSDLPLSVRSSSKSRVTGDLPGGAGGAGLRFHTFSGDVRVTK